MNPILKAIEENDTTPFRLKGTTRNARMRVAFIMAAEQGNLDAVKILLNECPETEDRNLAFQKAIEEDQKDVFLLLLPHVDPTHSKGMGITTASWLGHYEIVKHLLPFFQDDQLNILEKALFSAAYHGQNEVTTLLLETLDARTKAAPDAITPYRVKAVQSAASTGHLRTVQILMEGLSIEKNLKIIEHALPSAAGNGQTAIIDWMIQCILTQNPSENQTIQTGLHNAIIKATEKGQWECVKRLIPHGRNPNTLTEALSVMLDRLLFSEQTANLSLYTNRMDSHSIEQVFLEKVKTLQFTQADILIPHLSETALNNIFTNIAWDRVRVHMPRAESFYQHHHLNSRLGSIKANGGRNRL